MDPFQQRVKAGHPGWSLVRHALLVFVLLLSCAARRPLLAQSVTLAAGTSIPVRFVNGVRSGRDRVGSVVLLQTMAAITRDSCMVLAPFRTVWATVSTSKGGRTLGRGGEFGLATDSLRRLSGHVIRVEAVLDSLEWAAGSSRLLASGIVEEGHRTVAGDAVLPAIAATGGLAILPVALIGGWSVLRHGAGVEILAGELGGIRLVEALEVGAPASCRPVTPDARSLDLPALPSITPRATDRTGMVLGDQFNVILLGTSQEVREAFRAAGWTPEGARSVGNLIKGTAAVAFSEHDSRVAFSPEFYEGRVQDLGFQRVGLSARERHHVRLWQLDTHPDIWVGAANEDVGLKVVLDKLSATHRMDPDIDDERDILSGDLEAGGCARFLGLVALPGAVTAGRNTSNQSFRSDGRSAVLRAGCGVQDLQPR